MCRRPRCISYSVGMKIARDERFNVVIGFAVLALMVRTFSPSRAIERAESWRDPPYRVRASSR